MCWGDLNDCWLWGVKDDWISKRGRPGHPDVRRSEAPRAGDLQPLRGRTAASGWDATVFAETVSDRRPHIELAMKRNRVGH